MDSLASYQPIHLIYANRFDLIKFTELQWIPMKMLSNQFMTLTDGHRTFNSLGYWATRSSPREPGPVSIWRCRLTNIGIPIILIRRSHCLIFIKEIPCRERPTLYWDGPWWPNKIQHSEYHGMLFLSAEIVFQMILDYNKFCCLRLRNFKDKYYCDVYEKMVYVK